MPLDRTDLDRIERELAPLRTRRAAPAESENAAVAYNGWILDALRWVAEARACLRGGQVLPPWFADDLRAFVERARARRMTLASAHPGDFE